MSGHMCIIKMYYFFKIFILYFIKVNVLTGFNVYFFFISAQFFVVQPINDLFTTTTAVKRPIVPLNSEVSRNKRVDRTVVTVSIVKLLLVFMLYIKK